MHTVTDEHVSNINKLMLACIASYIASYAKDETDAEMLRMYAGDVAENAAKLAAFNKQRDADRLYVEITYNDTIVREEFSDVLIYMQQNELVAESLVC